MAAPYFSFQPSAVSRQKQAMRAAALAARAAWDGVAAGEAIARHVLAAGLVPRGAVVAGVWPMPGEIDLRPLWHALHARGHAVLLPETTPRGEPLLFRHWQPGATMLAERFGTARPDGPPGLPDLLFVPLLAFDRRGYRLGYGGGYYDRTLAALPGREAIGFAWAAQEVPSVPAEPHDVPLASIVTEKELILPQRAGSAGPLRP